MSKSLGNIISPEDVIKKYGADILRICQIQIIMKILKSVLRTLRDNLKVTKIEIH